MKRILDGTRAARANEEAWTHDDLVRHYSDRERLLRPPEESIVRLLEPRLATFRMLDIGVGGGRTTQYFAGVVKEYVGIDYSDRMVTACRTRFADRIPPVRFEKCNAEDMTIFSDAIFDFVLFSLNGIDYATHEGRLRILTEVQRVIKDGGYFCFSAHNLLGLRELFRFSEAMSASGGRLGVAMRRWAGLRFKYNRPGLIRKARSAPFVLANDGAHESRFVHYYVRPAAQVAQLNPYFNDVRGFAGMRGEELCGTELLCSREPWLYYMCRKRRR